MEQLSSTNSPMRSELSGCAKELPAAPELKLRRCSQIFKIVSNEIIFEFFQMVRRD